ncbi:hypothetical protein DP83_14810 [Vibrio metoecus]|uniref:Uncharacterized protein n=1 Tax=Vibrio metoecus TaxID=1481663 RepID=A0ABR4RWC2_VIBMT|nr:hypothetical protein DP83_14810 [Vibrio metoecus]
MKRLLCLSFNDLRFTKTKINPALTHKQKPKPRKLKRLIDLEKQTSNFGNSSPKTCDHNID